MDRRAFIAAAAVAPVAIAVPGLAGSSGGPFATIHERYNYYYDALCADDIPENEIGALEDAFISARDKLIDTPPETPHEFSQKFVALWKEGGRPDDETIVILLADARRLAA